MLTEVPRLGDLHSTRVLSLDATGRILDWISWQDAVCLYVRDVIAWTLGDPCLSVHGGTNRDSGEQSVLYLHPIVASTGHCRDHVLPISKGGRDTWQNVVTACWHCNVRKGNRTPAQASMPLLAVPYRPSWVEHLILSNRNILADQMEFLVNHLPRDRRPH
jgi:hypothetical protein